MQRTFVQNLGYVPGESNWLKYFGLTVTAQQPMPIITERIIQVICEKGLQPAHFDVPADSIVAESSSEYFILKYIYQQ